MKFYKETTVWPDSMPNGTYLLDDAKTKMYAYVKPGARAVFKFKNPIRIDTRGRKFEAVENTFNYNIKEAVAEYPRWEVKGSKGETYIVEKVEDVYNCTCSGFRFRGECKHVKAFNNDVQNVVPGEMV